MRQIFFTFFVFCCCITKAQTKVKSKYKVGKIPDLAFFKKMTSAEVRLDSLKDTYNLEKLEMMKNGKAFIASVPNEFIKKQLELQKSKVNHHYKDNRSRYIFAFYKNNEIENYTLPKDTLTTECNCFLDNDTIKVKMGMWVFGGFGFDINLQKDGFSATYWEDTHKQKFYKKSLKDSVLTDNVLLTFKEQFLILDTKPNFILGEKILAGLKFKTINYYRSADYEKGMTCDTCSDSKMDTMFLDGILYFKCILRKKTIEDR